MVEFHALRFLEVTPRVCRPSVMHLPSKSTVSVTLAFDPSWEARWAASRLLRGARVQSLSAAFQQLAKKMANFRLN